MFWNICYVYIGYSRQRCKDICTALRAGNILFSAHVSSYGGADYKTKYTISIAKKDKYAAIKAILG